MLIEMLHSAKYNKRLFCRFFSPSSLLSSVLPYLWDHHYHYYVLRKEIVSFQAHFDVLLFIIWSFNINIVCKMDQALCVVFCIQKGNVQGLRITANPQRIQPKMEWWRAKNAHEKNPDGNNNNKYSIKAAAAAAAKETNFKV